MLTNTVVNRNIAGGGGGIDTGGFVTVTITHCGFSDNLAGVGGAISCTSVRSVTVTDSMILRNRAIGSGGGIFHGALSGLSTVTITNSTIRENYGAHAGGGIQNEGNVDGHVMLNVDKTTVSDNHAAAGGGIFNHSGSGSATATLSNSTLTGNAADVDADPFDFDLNYAPGGGGVFNSTSGLPQVAEVKLTNCTLSGNSTRYKGGGILNYLQGNGVINRVTMDNCTLSGNSAENGGDSIWNEVAPDPNPPPPPDPCPPPPPGLPPCPPPGPPGTATLDIANTILDAGASGGNIQNVLGTVISRGYNLTSDNGGGFLTGPGDLINTNPLLGTLQNNGGPTLTHALLFFSPAINAGDPNFNPLAFTPPLAYDQRSGPDYPRVVNSRIDIGAFEFNNLAARGVSEPTSGRYTLASSYRVRKRVVAYARTSARGG